MRFQCLCSGAVATSPTTDQGRPRGERDCRWFLNTASPNMFGSSQSATLHGQLPQQNQTHPNCLTSLITPSRPQVNSKRLDASLSIEQNRGCRKAEKGR